MKVTLRGDWDAQIRPPVGKARRKGHFVGRKKEVSQLANEIARRQNGSILVSGHRGVGKTSLAYRAVSEAQARARKRMIVVLLNAAQLEAESDEGEEINPRRVIENLIRRLYSTARDFGNLSRKVKKRIDVLYRKAVAAGFEEKQILQSQEESSREILEERVTELLFPRAKTEMVLFVSSWTLAAALLFSGFIPWDWLGKLVSLLLAFPIPYASSLAVRKATVAKKSSKAKAVVEEIYRYDNSIGNLEFDLEQIHRDISGEGKKLVYIIDELDKLKTERTKEVLRFFKNLFTLSDALFIFVGGEEMYHIGEPRQVTNQQETHAADVEDTYRPKEYTYFTSKYFLSRPLWEDLETYLDTIMEVREPAKAEELQLLKRALCFEAKNDFFDLAACIRDRVVGFDEKNRPIVTARATDDDMKKARLHKAITLLFEKKYMAKGHTKWIQNEKLMRALFAHAHSIYSSYSGSQFVDPRDDSLYASIIRDFNGFLSRLGALNFVSEEQGTIRGLEVRFRTYQYTGSVPTEPPDELQEPTEIERRFLMRFEEYCGYIMAIVNAGRSAAKQDPISHEEFWESPADHVQQINSLGFDALAQFNAHNPAYQRIKGQSPPYPYRREEIERMTAEIENHTKSMLASLPVIASRALATACGSLGLQLQTTQKNASLFGGAASPIRDALNAYNPPVVFKQDLSRQVLFIRDKVEEINRVSRQIEDNSHTHAVVSINDEMADFDIEGLNYIVTRSAEDLTESMDALFSRLADFFAEANPDTKG